MIKVDLSGAEKFFAEGGPDYAAAAKAHETLTGRTGAGADFTGWLELPQRIRDGELPAILDAARLIRSRSKALVVIGIGGSYLGARGAIELLKPIPGPNDPKIFFVGNGISADALCGTIELLSDMDFDVNVISKSGTTLEPAIAFRIFRELLQKKYGDKANEHIFETTDAHKGVLKELGADFAASRPARSKAAIWFDLRNDLLMRIEEMRSELNHIEEIRASTDYSCKQAAAADHTILRRLGVTADFVVSGDDLSGCRLLVADAACLQE